MRRRNQWVAVLALVFPVGLLACSPGSASSSVTTAPRTTPPVTTAPATVAAAPAPTAPALNGAFNNVGISDDANPAAGNLDGGGYSYSAEALAAAGLTPGTSVTHDGLTFIWPDVPVGMPDNVLASGQTIAISGSGTLGFLGASDYYSSSGTGTITYTDGTTQSFTLSLADWWANAAAPGSDILVSVPYMNTSNGQMEQEVSVYYAAVPLEAGETMQSVTLPDVSQQAMEGSPAMHIFAVAVSSPGNGGTWPGTTGPYYANEYYGYPYSNPPVCQANGTNCVVDKWHFYQGQCTSWVAYRLNELNGIQFSDTYGLPATGADGQQVTLWGSADEWTTAAAALHIRFDGTPALGSVAWWPNSSQHIGGHVAYVERVISPTSVVISEMNYDNENGFRVLTITKSGGDWPVYFIHIADR